MEASRTHDGCVALKRAASCGSRGSFAAQGRLAQDDKSFHLSSRDILHGHYKH